MKKLDYANELSAEIKELKYFIDTLDVSEISKIKPNTNAIINRSVETKYSIFGSRFYGMGNRENTINVPTEMIPSLVKSANELLDKKQKELESIFRA